MLERRYGTRRPGRRLAVIVVAVLVAGAGLGWLVWAAIVHANPAIDADVASFDVRSVHRIDATVRGPGPRPRQRRHLSAAGQRTGPLGGRGEPVPRGRLDRPGDDGDTVRTERRAITVEVVDCTPADG